MNIKRNNYYKNPLEDAQTHSLKQYSTSQSYFQSKIIDDIIQKKQSIKTPSTIECILTTDLKYNDDNEHLEKYYENLEFIQQMPQLLEYYKYYSQDAVCYVNREFLFISGIKDKKKAVLYYQLKKQLNLSGTKVQSEGIQNGKDSIMLFNKGIGRDKIRVENILQGISKTTIMEDKNNDQSYLVGEILTKMINHYGPSKMKSINKIDSEFRFMVHGQGNGQGTHSGMKIKAHAQMESTNTSSKNSVNYNLYGGNLHGNSANGSVNASINNQIGSRNCKIRKQNTRNLTHRRFASCELTNNGTIKLIQKQDYEKSIQKKNTRKLRRKSTQLLSTVQYNIPSNLEYRRSSIKTEEYCKNVRQTLNITNFRDRMEQLRQKIRKQKQNIYKKPQSACQKKRVKK